MRPAAASPADRPRGRRPALVRWGWGVLAAVLAITALVAFFPWNWLRGPLNRYVSERTGRHFEITRHLDVRLGRTTQVLADGIVFDNPAWAQEPHLVQAQGAVLTLRLWPLLRGRLEIPYVLLRQPRLGLELLPDGRRTWALGAQGERDGGVQLESLEIDRGTVHFLAPHLGADIRAQVAIDEPARLPLRFDAQGRWRGQPFQAQGRTSSVLALRGPPGQGFGLEVSAASGSTALQASGQVGSLAGFEGADLQVRLRGRDLADLYPIARLVLPATPPYEVAGRLQREGEVWKAAGLKGRLGRTDLAGDLTYDRSQRVPRLAGQVRSNLLDFDDLAPLVGLGHPPSGRRTARPVRAGGRVLPDTPLDLQRLHAMDADVRYAAGRVVNTRRLPLDRLSTHVRLQGGVLQLQPLALGMAGGQVAGLARIDASRPPAALRLDLRVRGLQLERLLPAADSRRASVGTLQGHIDLAGRGSSLARLLGNSSGEVSLLMGRGRISNLLLEIAGLDGAEIVKFVMGRDQQVALRCAAAGFAVKDGLMAARTLVLDTADTVIWGEGSINLATEQLDLTLHPRPKDVSILSLRSPLRLAGTLGAPEGSAQRGAVAARAGAALVLGAINPLLGLAATLETGPGKDVDCTAVLQQAAAPAAAAASAPGGAARR